MWIPILLGAGGYALKRMRVRRRKSVRHGRVFRRALAGGRGACRLWTRAQPITAAIVSEASPPTLATIDAVGPVNLGPQTQVAAYAAWSRTFVTNAGAAASMVQTKHIAELLTSGCRLDVHGRDLDVLRSIRDIGLIALAERTDRNPLQV